MPGKDTKQMSWLLTLKDHRDVVEAFEFIRKGPCQIFVAIPEPKIFK